MYVKNQYVKYYFRTDFHRKEKKVKSKSPRQQVSRFKNDPRVSNFRKCQLCYCPFLTFFLYYQNSYHVFDFLFSPHTLCSFTSRQHLGKGNMEAIKQPVGVQFLPITHSSYMLILHVYTKILYIRACFRDKAKISRVRKWVSFVILITRRRERKKIIKMHCIFSKRNKRVFISTRGHWRECHTVQILQYSLLIGTFPHA